MYLTKTYPLARLFGHIRWTHRVSYLEHQEKDFHYHSTVIENFPIIIVSDFFACKQNPCFFLFIHFTMNLPSSFKILFIEVLQGYSAPYSATSIYIHADYHHIESGTYHFTRPHRKIAL